MLLIQPLLQRVTEINADRNKLQARLQAALMEGNFDVLDNYFKDLENSTSGISGSDHADREYVFSFHLLIDTDTLPDCGQQHRLLHAWTQARPNSYYAYYFLGDFWQSVAGDIRTTTWAAQVGADRWLGAALARDNAAVVLLHSLTLHTAPVGALYLLMRVFALLREPDWMQALFDGQSAQALALKPDDYDAEIWRLALAHLDRYGGTRLLLPDSLPPMLRPREAQEEGTKYWPYWLEQILHICPNCLEALTTAVNFLSPRWGGSHETTQAFIEGPQCAALTEEQRGDLWWEKEHDYLENLPDHDDKEEITLHRAAYLQLLKRPLLTSTRIVLLLCYGEFQSYNGEIDDAYTYAAEACKLQVEVTWACSANTKNFDFIPRDIVEGGVVDTHGVLSQILQVAEREEESAWHLLLACAARHEGKWGMPCEPYPGQLDRLLILIASMNSKHDSVTAVLELLWESHHAECCWWLAHELANRGVALAQCFLANVYRGDYSDGPEVQVNASLAEQWQCSALEATIKHPSAHYLFAINYLIPDDFNIADQQVLSQVKSILEEAIENEVEGALHMLMQVTINSSSREEISRWHQQLILPFSQSEDQNTHLESCFALVALYGTGKGVIHSPYLAYYWSVYGQSIDDNDDYEEFFTKIREIYKRQIQTTGLRGLYNKYFVDDKWKEAVATGKAHLPPNINEDDYQWSKVNAGIAYGNLSLETAIANFSDHPSVANRISLFRLLEDSMLFLAAQSLPSEWGSGPVTLQTATTVPILTSSTPEGDEVLLAFTSQAELQKHIQDSASFAMQSNDLMELVVQQDYAALVLNPAGPWATISHAETEKILAGTW